MLLPSFGELATHTVDTSRCGVICQQLCQWLYHLVCVHCLAMAQLVGSFENFMQLHCTKAKQPESGDLCGNITEFGMTEGSPEPAGAKVILPPPQMK